MKSGIINYYRGRPSTPPHFTRSKCRAYALIFFTGKKRAAEYLSLFPELHYRRRLTEGTATAQVYPANNPDTHTFVFSEIKTPVRASHAGLLVKGNSCAVSVLYSRGMSGTLSSTGQSFLSQRSLRWKCLQLWTSLVLSVNTDWYSET